MVPQEQLQPVHAECDRAFGVWRRAQPRELGADEPVRSSPAGDQQGGDEHDRRRTLAAEYKNGDDRHNCRGDRGHDVGRPVEQQAQRADPACENGEREPGEQPGDPGQDNDEQGRARADQGEAEEVAPDRVGAEHERLAGRERPLGAGRAVDEQEDRLVRRDPVPVHGNEQEEAAEGQTGKEPGVKTPHALTVLRCGPPGSLVHFRPRRGVPSQQILGGY